MPFDYPGRIDRLQARLVGQGVDAALLSAGADLPYFTGYEAMPTERLTVLVVPSSGEPVLFVPELEEPRVEPGSFELRPWGEADEPVELATSILTNPSLVAVGDHMWSVFLTRFIDEWPHTSWIPASEVTSELRMRKDAEEVELLRQAGHAVDRVMAQVPDEVVFIGRTEADVARDLAEMIVEEGHDVAEFTIVAAGANGASPHHEPGDRVIEEGDLVVCDYGGRWKGYYSDSTRTFVAGDPSEEQTAVHQAVLAASEAGREAVTPGTPCQEIDRAARSVIHDAGFGDFFIHRTGHGIGLEVHEHPYLVDGNTRLLEPGMTFSVEPGIYLPDRFGVRIEDIVVCTDNGIESLNRSDRSLLSVG